MNLNIEVVTIIATSTVLIAILNSVTKWISESKKRKDEHFLNLSNATKDLVSLIRGFQEGEVGEFHEGERTNIISEITNRYLFWDSLVRPYCNKRQLKDLNSVRSEVLNTADPQSLFKSESSRMLDLTDTLVKRQLHLIYLLVYISLGTLAGLTSSLILLWWAGYQW